MILAFSHKKEIIYQVLFSFLPALFFKFCACNNGRQLHRWLVPVYVSFLFVRVDSVFSLFFFFSLFPAVLR